MADVETEIIETVETLVDRQVASDKDYFDGLRELFNSLTDMGLSLFDLEQVDLPSAKKHYAVSLALQAALAIPERTYPQGMYPEASSYYDGCESGYNQFREELREVVAKYLNEMG